MAAAQATIQETTVEHAGNATIVSLLVSDVPKESAAKPALRLQISVSLTGSNRLLLAS